jgi:redox-sensing transcriptional repressor
MPEKPEISSLTLNRLSVYLRCLRALEEEGVETISSQELARRFHLSSSQIRKDLTSFGEFGTRGVGYDVSTLAQRIHELLGLDVEHRLVIVGMGHLGSALASYFRFNDRSFRVVAGVDTDPDLVGTRIGTISVSDAADLPRVVAATEADIGVIAVPADAAAGALDRLVAAGIRSVLNFAPVTLGEPEGVRVRDVDMRVFLEEVAFFLQDSPASVVSADEPR